MKEKLLILLVSTLFGLELLGQDTGVFQDTLEINEAGYTVSRTLYYYVPLDYNSSNSYKLILGFRGGPHTNAGQFRTQLSPLADSLDAIIVCPENSADFNNNEGNVKILFNKTVEAVQESYSIDTNFVYITGLSYGGRHTIIVSMDSDEGDIPTNIRGIIPFAPGMNSQNVADYENSDLFPICTCIGDQDNTFMPVAETFHDSVIANGGNAMLNVIEGIGHTTNFLEFVDEMLECFDFIETSYVTSSINTHEFEGKLKVYPNPSSDRITVEYADTDELVIEITDLLGRKFFSAKYIEQGPFSIDVKKYKPGIYLLRLIRAQEIVAIKQLSIFK